MKLKELIEKLKKQNTIDKTSKCIVKAIKKTESKYE